ncbi:CRISPR-associated protein Cas4 [Pyrofollis japonicus]|uniref:CRISPR-associated protein Cas4 n=1 Tax=Pyrofollis japonicus TaxID=3060460 RepID=UPI00295BE443|nr:CRISPR-associated protein Cas4 [Pyrofollis japonicus]BEP16988.1 CRISPR-associated protein Cas4 [Pyrofollis japonicus]
MSILSEIYRIKQKEFTERLKEMIDPKIVYVTDLTGCSMKRIMRMHYPLLSFRFEPSVILGDLVHTGLEKILEEHGWASEYQVEKSIKVNGETYTLKGRVDLVKITDNGVEEVVEIKTGRDLPHNEPHDHHILQLKIYMYLLNAKKGHLLYITPERIVEFDVEYEPIDLESLVRETILNERAPRYEWECKYCPYRKLCPYARTYGKH